MGSAARRKPKRLAEKLLEIRVGLGLSQNGLIRQMGFADDLTQAANQYVRTRDSPAKSPNTCCLRKGRERLCRSLDFR